MKHLTKSNKTPVCSWRFEALGTAWEIQTEAELLPRTTSAVRERIKTYELTYSRFKKDSLVSRLKQPGMYVFPSDITPLLTVYKDLYNISDGRMTPLIGAMLEQAGYDANYSFTPKKITQVPTFEALGWDGERTLTVAEPITLDVGAAGKGYLVDIIAECLLEADHKKYVIDASGDIATKGRQQKVGLEHPNDATKVIGVVTIENESLCASATNRRAWQNMHHIFDPSTRLPATDIVATWVIASTTLLADALATALFFVAPTELLELYDFKYVTINKNGAVNASMNLNGELFV